jgi:DNA-binding response OmpR family regulator/EAL domain-containing protein (putative c-di-GMP-specific phosphodiesterase class I)
VSQATTQRSLHDLGKAVVLALRGALSARFDPKTALAASGLLEAIAESTKDRELAAAADELALGLGGFLSGTEPNPKQLEKLKKQAQKFLEFLRPNLKSEESVSVAAASQTVLYLHGGKPTIVGLKPLLSARKWALVEVHTGEEIDALVDRTTPVAVLVDSEYLGAIAEVVESVERNQPQQAMRIPVLAISPTADLPNKLQASIGGADAFLVTSDPSQLLARIDELMAPPEGEPFRVLVVDDDRQQSMFCEGVLKKKGMRTQAVANAEAALKVLDSFDPELVIVDLHMPGLNGMELTALIRERVPALLLPIIFLTGEMDTQKRFDALNVGGDDFFVKPIRPRHLASAVVTRIKRARSLRRQIMHGLSSGSGKEQALSSRGAFVESVKLACQGDSHTAVMFVAVDQIRGLDDLSLIMRSELEASLTSQMTQALKPTDHAALWQDFSFVVLLTRSSRDELMQAAEIIKEKIAGRPLKIGRESMPLTVSIGLAERPIDADVEDWLNAARAACRFAHKSGGNAIESVPKFIPAGLSLEDCFNMRDLLREAASKATTMLEFQPMVQLRGPHAGQYWSYLRLYSGEPGARPYHEREYEMVASSGLKLIELERHAIERSIEAIEQQAAMGKPLRLATRVSGANIRAKFIEWVNKTIGRESRWAGALILAVDAKDMVALGVAERAMIEGLPRPGVRLMLTGYQGTPEQQRLIDALPISEVELDASLTEDAKTTESLQNLAQIVAPLRLKARFVVARGLKHLSLLSNLWTLGVDYLISDTIRAPGPKLDYDFSETKF